MLSETDASILSFLKKIHAYTEFFFWLGVAYFILKTLEVLSGHLLINAGIVFLMSICLVVNGLYTKLQDDHTSRWMSKLYTFYLCFSLLSAIMFWLIAQGFTLLWVLS